MATTRKQVMLSDEQARWLREAALRLGCSEADVIRAAIDALARGRTLVHDLRPGDASANGTAPKVSTTQQTIAWEDDEDDADLSPEEIEELEREVDEWARRLDKPLGLSEAVIEDRR